MSSGVLETELRPQILSAEIRSLPVKRMPIVCSIGDMNKANPMPGLQQLTTRNEAITIWFLPDPVIGNQIRSLTPCAVRHNRKVCRRHQTSLARRRLCVVSGRKDGLIQADPQNKCHTEENILDAVHRCEIRSLGQKTHDGGSRSFVDLSEMANSCCRTEYE